MKLLNLYGYFKYFILNPKIGLFQKCRYTALGSTVGEVPFVVLVYKSSYMAVGQNLVPRVDIKIAGKSMFIPLKMVLIGIDS